MKLKKSILLGALFAFGFTIFTVSPLFAPFNEGCTPGFWKNHNNLWPVLTGIAMDAKLGDVFLLPTDPPESPPAWWSMYANDSLLDALSYPGGGGLQGAIRIFLRHATAAALNSYAGLVTQGGIHYRSPAFIIPLIDGTLMTGGFRGDFLGVKNLLDMWNNMGCPFDSQGRWE